MTEFLLCTVEDTFRIAGRGIIIAPFFRVDEYRFNSNHRVRVVVPNGDAFECEASFQVPRQGSTVTPLSYCCALLGVAQERVPVGSQLWLIDREIQEVMSRHVEVPERAPSSD